MANTIGEATARLYEASGYEVTRVCYPSDIGRNVAMGVWGVMKKKSEKPGDVSPEEERELCRLVQEETGSELVFLTDYSSEIRPFYHMRYAEDPKTTKSFDLLYRGLEITTGAQREHRYDVLIAQAKEKGMGLESLEHYLNFFKYGCPPHGGVGVGPGRIIMKLLDLASVKEATFFPRDVKRLTP